MEGAGEGLGDSTMDPSFLIGPLRITVRRSISLLASTFSQELAGWIGLKVEMLVLATARGGGGGRWRERGLPGQTWARFWY